MEYLKIDDFKNYRFLSQLKFSNDEKKSALIAKIANCDNGYYSMIYVDKGLGYYPLTDEKGNVSSFIWLDDENILFCEIRDELCKDKSKKGIPHKCYYKININVGEAKHAFCIDSEVLKLEALDCDNFLISAVVDDRFPNLEGKPEYEQDDILKEYKKEKDYEIIDEFPFWYNGSGFIYKKRKGLYLYNVNTGLKPLTDDLCEVESYRLSPCKKYVVYSERLDKKDFKQLKNDLYLIEIETRKTSKLIKEPMIYHGFDFWGDKLVIAASLTEDKNIHQHPTFYILNIKDNSMEKILKYDRSICSPVATDCALGGGYVEKVFKDDYYFISLDGFYSDVYKLSLKDYSLLNVTNSKGSVQFFDINSKSLLCVGFLDGKLQEVYNLDGESLKKNSNFNDEIFNKTKHPKIEHHVIKDKEGVEFDGWVLFPVDYDENKKYPAILDIHGGPKAAYGDIYFHEMQYFANLNYFVLFSNPRGSDGKGNCFADIRGRYGTIDYDNLMQFVDEMIEKYPAILKDKIGVIGGSYGGFMTNWIIGHTDRFKAAASQRSISNWFSKIMSDIGYFFIEHEHKSTPWHDYEKLWHESPLKYADKVKTPTLFIHSDEDYRCNIDEGYQMFTALKLHGVKTRLCVFHGENHELSRSGKPEHRLRRLKEITDWMNLYLK